MQIYNPVTAPIGASAYNSAGTITITGGGYSGALPLDSEEFDTDNIHKSTNEDSGTATGAQTGTTLKDTTKTWTVNAFSTYQVRITGGTGIGQIRKITSNTADTLTVPIWTTTPDATSTYIIYITSRLTVQPGQDGLYFCMGKIAHSSGTLGSRGVGLWLNNTFKGAIFILPILGIENDIEIVKVLNLVAGDYLELQAYQDSGINATIIGGASRCFLQMVKTGL